LGNITGYNQLKFKSASKLFSKIKREFKSFADVNLMDDSDFPQYISEVLNKLGVGTFKEEEAVLTVKNKKAELPKNFKQLYAAYKCGGCEKSFTGRHLQNKYTLENDITCSILSRAKNCELHCECPDKIIESVTVKQYVNEDCLTSNYKAVSLLKLSPNVKPYCSEDCINTPFTSSMDEITITNGQVFTNFSDGDIYMQYYAFPVDEEGIPEIPDVIEIEKACEWYIKYQMILNWWFVDDLKDSNNKWAKAEMEYEKWMAEARTYLKTPSFAQMVNTIRNKRSMNMLTYFNRQIRTT
jgi:hypothetical protein